MFLLGFSQPVFYSLTVVNQATVSIVDGFAWIHVTPPVFKMSTSIFSKETIANGSITRKGKALRVRSGREEEQSGVPVVSFDQEV